MSTKTDNLSVGFLSLLSPTDFGVNIDGSPTTPIRKKKSINHEEEVQSFGDKYNPEMAKSGPLMKRTTGRWVELWAECTLSGTLSIKSNENSKKPIKKYPLKTCTIVKISDKEFNIKRPEKRDPVKLKAKTAEQAAIWIPTLSQYSSEMYTALRVKDIKSMTIIWNERGIIIAANEIASNFLGYGEEDLVGKHFKHIIHESKGITNEYLHVFTKTLLSRSPPDNCTTVTLTPNKSDDIYALYTFGQYEEFGQTRNVLTFQSTSGKLKLQKQFVGLPIRVSWILWGNI